jgi:hypothetical protein
MAMTLKFVKEILFYTLISDNIMSVEERRDSIIESFNQLPAEEQNSLLLNLFEGLSKSREDSIVHHRTAIKAIEKAQKDLHEKFDMYDRIAYAEDVR